MSQKAFVWLLIFAASKSIEKSGRIFGEHIVFNFGRCLCGIDFYKIEINPPCDP